MLIKLVKSGQTFRLFCDQNKLKNLDVSKNGALLSLFCSSNELTSLNLKNGNNLTLDYFDARMNRNLNCIQVDKDNTSSSRWFKDDQAKFSAYCR